MKKAGFFDCRIDLGEWCRIKVISWLRATNPLPALDMMADSAMEKRVFPGLLFA